MFAWNVANIYLFGREPGNVYFIGRNIVEKHGKDFKKLLV